MLKNYVKVAFRNIKRNKLYAFLNVFGLSVGLASFFVICLFVQNETSYDSFHKNYEQIYRVIEHTNDDSGSELRGGLTGALAPAASQEIPEIEAFSRIENRPKSIVIPESKGDTVDQVNSLGVDEGFIDIFSLDIIASSSDNLLEGLNDMLLCESKASLYFGSPAGAIGKTIKVRGTVSVITGVFKDLPKNTSFPAHMVGKIRAFNSFRRADWASWNTSYFDQSYFLLNAQADIEAVESKINEIAKEQGIDDKSYSLQPLSEVHFSLDTSDSVAQKTDRDYIFIFSAVAIFILCCAVFNYVSLTLSQSLERLKEVGVRKVVGAHRKQLILQSILESVIHSLLAFIIAIVLVEVFLPELENVLSRSLEFTLSSSSFFIVGTFVFSVFLAILSAVYPAYLNTKQNLVGILKGGTGKWSSQRLINAVTVFQLLVFMVLISVAFTANRQLKFMQNENLGFDHENQLVVQMFSPMASQNGEVFKNELLKNPGIESVSLTSSVPTRVMGTSRFNDYDFMFFNFDVDHEYLKTLDMELVEGRSFTPEDMSNENIILINETAAEMMSFEGEAVGKSLNTGNKELHIIGVVRDFHFLSKKQEIGPTLFKPIQGNQGINIIKLSGKDIIATVDFIKKEYGQITDGEEMRYFFLDDQIESQYKQEKVMITVINTFTVLAAIVALLGLFGMAGYATKRRLKEMGIRKVLGANFMSVQMALNAPSLIKLVVAALIGLPLIYLWMDNWLNSFAYRIELPLALIIVAICLASLVVLLTTTFHSIRAYFINPVEILKDE